ncbi:MAG TPA: gpW family head-tail joining protein [Thermomicrobiales bacterium]|jgi:hypothetical protein|nr:gpW family head-tail joining protein [Thermomicrobiales bacterium]
MSETLIWQTQLAEAKEALHQLVIGKMVRVVVDQNGERVEFTMTNIAALRAYIADLEARIAGASTYRRPIGFLF